MSRPPAWWRVLAMTISLGLTVSADPGPAATRPVGVRILDPFTASAHEVAALHRRHWRVACLLHAGIWEPARPDAHRFAPEWLGTAVTQGAGRGTGMGSSGGAEPPPELSRWLDLSRRDTLVGILADRLAMCAAKGFDGAALADLDGDPDQSGFPLARRDQGAFAAALRTVAERLGLTVSVTPTSVTPTSVHADRGRGWQRGQEYDERFVNGSRRIAAPQRRHGCPSRP